MNKLHITQVEKSSQSRPSPTISRGSRRQEMQATMERLWLQNPSQFDPQRDSIQRQRLKYTFDAINTAISLQGALVADLGCGAGDLTRMLRDAGATLHALDIAGNALQKLKENDMTRITPYQECLPNTTLKDNAYDLVLCTELIGYLHKNEYRLLLNEMARLVKNSGIVACSTAFDINTEDPLDQFASLAETEFTIDRWVLSNHRLLLKLCQFFEAPEYYIKASNNKSNVMQKKSSLQRLFTSVPMVFIWKGVNLIAKPIAHSLRQSNWIRDKLEKISMALWSQLGTTHALFIGRKRPLSFPLPSKEIPKELKHKRQVWE